MFNTEVLKHFQLMAPLTYWAIGCGSYKLGLYILHNSICNIIHSVLYIRAIHCIGHSGVFFNKDSVAHLVSVVHQGAMTYSFGTADLMGK